MIYGLDLFSGIGGISLALSEWVRPVCYVEIDEYAQGVLKSRMADGKIPDAPIWSDVRTLDGRQFRGLVDIIYGGFPCQDLSVAGLRGGLESERSGLFFEIMRLVEEIKPAFIFLENVSGIRKYLHLVAREMAEIRYDCRWGALSAYDVGAPHQRERWFLLAHNSCKRRNQGRARKPWASSENFSNSHSSRQLQSKGRKQIKRRWSFNRGWWLFEPDVVRVVNGLSFRVDRIKCLGNAVVPLQAKEAFKRLMGLDER